MTVTLQPDQVRQLVARVLQEYGVAADEIADLRESIRIDEGRLVARTYRAGGLMAMWLYVVGLLQFYDSDGNMLRTVNLFEELTAVRAAA